MEVSTNTEDFRPFTLNITFDSIDEVAQFDALFNHAALDDAMPNIDDGAIQDAIASCVDTSLPQFDVAFDTLSAILGVENEE